MAECKVTAGIDNDCADLISVGGLDGDFWIGYITDLDTQISLAQVADINTIDFGGYGGLYKFSGAKFSHSAGASLVVTQGGNKHWTHTLNVKLATKSTSDDVQMQYLETGRKIFAIIQDNNNNFFILGAGNGLSANAADWQTGETAESDTTDTVTLAGAEKTKPLRFNVGSVTATLARLADYEI